MITYPVVSPHVGSTPSSQKKLPAKAHAAATKRATGTEAAVINNAGRTANLNSLRKRKSES